MVPKSPGFSADLKYDGKFEKKCTQKKFFKKIIFASFKKLFFIGALFLNCFQI